VEDWGAATLTTLRLMRDRAQHDNDAWVGLLSKQVRKRSQSTYSAFCDAVIDGPGALHAMTSVPRPFLLQLSVNASVEASGLATACDELLKMAETRIRLLLKSFKATHEQALQIEKVQCDCSPSGN
jgi:hypothetical protein